MSRLALLVAVLLAGPAFGADEPFADLDFDAAAAKAKDGGKLLLVDFTATWCPPCKMMEKQTWPDEKVRAWVAEHAVAIQVDIDKQPELAQRFGFDGIPTVIFLKDGKELDRHTGYRSAVDFLGWADGVLAGKSESAAAMTAARGALDSDDVESRYDAAREALGRRDYELALQHLLWLWPNSRSSPSFIGVRLSFMVADMASLAKVYEPARVAFRHLLDQVQVKVEEHDVHAPIDWMEWSALCREFHETDRIIAWYESNRDEQGRMFGSASVPQVVQRPIDDLFKLLLDARRPVDAVRLYPDLRAASQRRIAAHRTQMGTLKLMSADVYDMMHETAEKQLRELLGAMYGAALADGRTEEAVGVANDLLGVLDDSDSRVELVKQALDLAAARPTQLATWLDEAAAKGADVTELRARLAAAAASAK